MSKRPIPEKISPQKICENILLSPKNNRNRKNFFPKQKTEIPIINKRHPIEKRGFISKAVLISFIYFPPDSAFNFSKIDVGTSDSDMTSGAVALFLLVLILTIVFVGKGETCSP